MRSLRALLLITVACGGDSGTAIDAPSLATLTVGERPVGSAFRTISDPPGIDCGEPGTTCSAQFVIGTTITLTDTRPAQECLFRWPAPPCPSAQGTTCNFTLVEDSTINVGCVNP